LRFDNPKTQRRSASDGSELEHGAYRSAEFNEARGHEEENAKSGNGSAPHPSSFKEEE
jgi:hypothetical protein